jgi:hypothetical protein
MLVRDLLRPVSLFLQSQSLLSSERRAVIRLVRSILMSPMRTLDAGRSSGWYANMRRSVTVWTTYNVVFGWGFPSQ